MAQPKQKIKKAFGTIFVVTHGSITPEKGTWESVRQEMKKSKRYDHVNPKAIVVKHHPDIWNAKVWGFHVPQGQGKVKSFAFITTFNGHLYQNFAVRF